MRSSARIFADSANGFVELNKQGFIVCDGAGNELSTEEFKSVIFNKIGVGAKIDSEQTITFIDQSVAWLSPTGHWESQPQLGD